jgi:hypothetical protein
MDARTLTMLANYYPKDSNGIKLVFNPYELYDFIMPESIRDEKHHLLWHQFYDENVLEETFRQDDLDLTIIVRYIQPECYDEYFKKEEVLHYEHYVLQNEAKTIHVFRNDSSCFFLGNVNGHGFQVLLWFDQDVSIEERQNIVTDEWIMEFGLKKCE